MRCSKIERMLTPLLDDRLASADRTLVEQHLETCPQCRQTHALLAAAGQLLSAQAPAEPPADLAERVARAAFTANPVDSSGWLGELMHTMRWPALGTATAALVLAVGLLTSLPEHVQNAGVSPESMAAIFATENDVVSDDELLSDVLGQEEE